MNLTRSPIQLATLTLRCAHFGPARFRHLARALDRLGRWPALAHVYPPARRQLLDVSDEVATRVAFLFCSDAKDALLKALDE